jgi:hypothetical protein
MTEQVTEPPREVPPLEFWLITSPKMRAKVTLATIGILLLCVCAPWWAFTHHETLKDILAVPLVLALLLSLSVVAPTMPWRFYTQPVLLRIDTRGLTLPKIGLVPWEDIDAWRSGNEPEVNKIVADATGRKSATIRIAVLSPERYRARLSLVSRLNWADQLTWGKTELGFNDVFLSQPASKIAAGIEAHRSWARLKASKL